MHREEVEARNLSAQCRILVHLIQVLGFPPQIQREAIANVKFPNFMGNQRQKWIQLT